MLVTQVYYLYIYIYAYKLTLVLVKMSIFEQKTLFEIRLKKMDKEWKYECQVVDRPPSDRGSSVASGSRQSMGNAVSLRSPGRRPSDLPTRTISEWVF
jgi:hypothetical protein